MKQLFFRALTFMSLIVAATIPAIAQNGFAYQAVIRDGEGNLITNSEVELKFSLINGGKTQYAETQKAKANQYGNISVMIGEGEKTEGDFSKVPWSTLDITLKVEVKPAGSDKFIELGQTKINPVPYAMYAAQGGGAATVKGAAKDAETLFEVSDREGRPVFAVTNDGIVVYVDDTDSSDKVRRSGFLIVGRDATKGESEKEYFSVTTEGTQIYVDDEGSDKVRRSGFLIVGRDAAKEEQADYLKVDGTGTTVYVDANGEDKVRRSGFLIVGRDATKGVDANLFAADAGGTTVYVDDAEGEKVRRSGFLIVGRDATKADRDQYMAVTSEKVNINTTAFTVTERNEELGTVQSMISVNTSDNGQAQVMVHTDIAMEDEVIEVADAPMQGEYAMAVNDSMWFIPAKVNDYNYDPEFNQLMAIYGEGEYAPAVSIKIGEGNNSITIPSLFFDSEGNPTSNAKKAAVVVFDYPEEEGIYVIRPFVPMANKTIEFGLMNTDGEFVKITTQINSKDGVPFDVSVGDFDGGKITNAGGGYFGSTINLVAVPDKGKIFAGWQTTITIDIDHDIFEYPSYRREYPLNGLPLIDEKLFGSDGWQLPPVFTAPELYVSYNAFRYGHGFSDEWSIKSIDQAIDIIAEYVSENLADNNLDWTINVVDWVYGAQDIPESTYIETQTPDQPSTEEEVVIKDIVKSIRLTGISEESKIDGSWWYSEGEDKWYYGDGGSDSPTPALSVKTQAPVIIDNLTITRGYARFGGGIFMDEGANVTIADGVNITGNTAIASAVDSACGGGIYVGNGAIVTITNGVTIADNTSSSETEKHAYGGGVYVGRCANVTIANGATIDGNKALASAENNSYGGGIYVGPGACVTIADGTYITDNSALSGKYGYGGGVYVSKNNQDVKGILYMTGGQINGNAATTGGGGIFGTGLVVIGSSAVIGNTDITDARGINDESYANKALSGGGIHSNGDLYIGYKLKDGATEITPDNLEEDDKSNVTIQGNYVYCINDYSITLTDGQGGGVYHRSYNGSGAFKMYKTTVAYNRSVSSRDGSGAGVYCVENTAGDKMFKQCQIVGNYSNKAGAGIGIDEGILTIDNTLIYNNSLDGSGQCIGGAGVAVTSNGKLSMENSEIYDNDASYAFTGGGVKVAGGFFYANNCKFYGNHASSGAGLNVNGGKAVLNGTTIVGDKDAHQAPSSGSINGFKGNYSESVNELGAGISVDYYGKLYIGYKMNNFVVGEPDGKSNVKIIGNYSAGKGGGISINGENALVAMHNATVMHNSANGKGNGVYHLNGPFSVSGNTTFDEDNDVYLDNEKVVTVGALDESAAVNITIETIRVGTKVLEPANDGIELADYINRFTVNDLPEDFSINDNGVIVVDEINVGDGQYFESIAAAIDAINMLDDDSKTYTINIVSDLNESQYIGGEIKASTIKIEGNGKAIDLGWDGKLTDDLTLTADQDDLGAALTIATNEPVTIENLTITGGCQRNDYGSGITIGGEYTDENSGEDKWYEAKVTLGKGVIVKQNYGNYGGGVAVLAGATLTIESDAEISNNTSDYGGGGIYIESNIDTDSATVVMNGGTIKLNKCRVDDEGWLGGAGVLLYGAAKFEMNDGSITENESFDYGGGVGMVYGARFVMNNGSITNNKAVDAGSNSDDSRGGGVFVKESEFTLNGGTISDNTAVNGSGVFVHYYGDAKFIMNANAKVDASNDVYLFSNTSNSAKITIGREFTGTDIAAIITPHNYQVYTEVLNKQDAALTADDLAHFAVKSEGTTQWTIVQKEGDNTVGVLMSISTITVGYDNLINTIQSLTGITIIKVTGETSSNDLSGVNAALKSLPSAMVILDFSELSGLTELEYQKSFAKCTNLLSITLPSGITSIDSYAFDGCSALKEILVAEGGSFYSIDGILYKSDGATTRTLVRYPNAKSDIDSFIVPSDVTSIAQNAFSDCSGLKSVTIPDGVSLNVAVFQSNKVIEHVSLPSDLKTIPQMTFHGCEALAEIDIPANVTEIGGQAFMSCKSVSSVVIPNNVVEIKWDAFTYCNSLETISIPKSVKNITSSSNSVFYDCDKLTTVKYEGTETDKEDMIIQDEKLNQIEWTYQTYP